MGVSRLGIPPPPLSSPVEGEERIRWIKTPAGTRGSPCGSRTSSSGPPLLCPSQLLQHLAAEAPAAGAGIDGGQFPSTDGHGPDGAHIGGLCCRADGQHPGVGRVRAAELLVNLVHEGVDAAASCRPDPGHIHRTSCTSISSPCTRFKHRIDGEGAIPTRATIFTPRLSKTKPAPPMEDTKNPP